MRDFTLLFPIHSCIISSSLHFTFLLLFNSSLSTFMILAKNKVLRSMWIYITITKYDFSCVLSTGALKYTPLFQSVDQINHSNIFEFELLGQSISGLYTCQYIFSNDHALSIIFKKKNIMSVLNVEDIMLKEENQIPTSPLHTMTYSLSYMQTLKMLLNRK